MAKKRKIKKHSKAWQHTDKILEMYRGGKTLTGIENALGLDGVLVSYRTIRKILKNAGEQLPEPAKRGALQVEEPAKEGIKGNRHTVGDIVDKNTPTRLERVIEEAAKPAEYPKFQKNKEYLFTTDTRPSGRNPTATKGPLYVFVCAIDSPYRKYPLYLFRHKKAGWRETFTPMQLMEFKVSAAAGATK